MPLFSSRRDHSSDAWQDRSHKTAATAPEPSANTKKHGFFHRRSNSSTDGGSDRHSSFSSDGRRDGGMSRSSTERRGHLMRSHGHGTSKHDELDPSIAAARERVIHAERAEKEADRAMAEARARVREAKEEVKRMEEEAREEARRAKIKQDQAREVSKRGKGLGRA